MWQKWDGGHPLSHSLRGDQAAVLWAALERAPGGKELSGAGDQQPVKNWDPQSNIPQGIDPAGNHVNELESRSPPRKRVHWCCQQFPLNICELLEYL